MTSVGARTAQKPAAQTRREQLRAARLNRTMLKIVFVVLAVSVFVYVTGMVRIIEGSRIINDLRAQIRDAKHDNQQLELKLDQQYNKNMIKDKAMSELGMRYPTAASVSVITLPGDVGNGGTQTVYDAAGESDAP